MQSLIVVVPLECTQHGCGVTFVADQETVEELVADRRDEAVMGLIHRPMAS